MRFDVSRVLTTIDEICENSTFLDPYDPDPADPLTTRRQVDLSRRRIAVVLDQFHKLGYEVYRQNFMVNGVRATNVLFSQGGINNGSLLLAAHHDYCAGLGAEDNATGLAMIVELARCIKANTHIVFASFDLEEMGLLGSRNYVKSCNNQIENISAVIALDCLGSGSDLAICSEVVGAKSDPMLVSGILSSGRDLGYKPYVETFDWLNADQVPFAEKGIKTAQLFSYNLRNYEGKSSPRANVAHSELDIPKSIKPRSLGIVGDVLIKFIDDLYPLNLQ